MPRRLPARLPPHTLLGTGISTPALVGYTGAAERTDVDDFIGLRIETGLRGEHGAVAIWCHAVASAMGAIASRQDGNIAVRGCHGCNLAIAPCQAKRLPLVLGSSSLSSVVG